MLYRCATWIVCPEDFENLCTANLSYEQLALAGKTAVGT